MRATGAVALFTWVAANPGTVVVVAYHLCCLVVALTPSRLQKRRWFGPVLWAMHRASYLTHADQPGTLQWPVIAREVLFGHDHTAVTTVESPDAPAHRPMPPEVTEAVQEVPPKGQGGP